MMMHIATQHATLDPRSFAGLRFREFLRQSSLASRVVGFLHRMASRYAEQWAGTETLAKGDLGLEHASPKEALDKMNALQLPVMEAIMLGAKPAKRDWCKLCA